MKFVEI